MNKDPYDVSNEWFGIRPSRSGGGVGPARQPGMGGGGCKADVWDLD